MNDGQLQSFIAAVDAGSFRKAAKEQYLTVPSFVQRINALEGELGYALFERNAQGVTPTPEGRTFYDSAVQALTILNSAKATGRKPAEKESRIAVGVWWRATSHLLEACEEFTLRHPDTAIEFVEYDWESAPEAMHEGKIDVFFGARSNKLAEFGLDFTEFSRNPFYCVFSPHCDLAQYDILTSDLLDDYIVYAGADWSEVPELTQHTKDFFKRESVKKKSIFSEKLVVDCLQGKAVSFFGLETLSYTCPPLEARPLDWPAFSSGAFYQPNPSPKLQEFIALFKEYRQRLIDEIERNAVADKYQSL